MTNREIYIEQMKNQELSEVIVHRVDRCAFCKKNKCPHRNMLFEYRLYELCKTQIEQWLSQEVELSANEMFEEFIDEIKQRLLAYEMDESCFDDYNDEDRQMMRRLREALYRK